MSDQNLRPPYEDIEELSLFDSEEEVEEADNEDGKGRKPLSDAFDTELLLEISNKELNKRYYGIGEVADMFRVNTSLIRFWENNFDILKPRKNRKGDRLFRPEDIRNLQLIYYLLRERKFTIEGAKQRLKEEKKAAQEDFEMVQSLLNIKQFLIKLKESL